MNVSTSEIILRLLAATICGGLVGWERGASDKSAGLRTHILVAIGSATYVLMAIQLPVEFQKSDYFELDPSRIVQGIIGGIGFLGAGMIFRTGASVHGLTTASGVWVIAATGIACGLGHYRLAFPVVVLVMIVNGLFVWIDPKKILNNTDDDAENGQEPQE